MNRRVSMYLLLVLFLLIELIHPLAAHAAWSKPADQVNAVLKGVERGPDRFVAVGPNGTIMYSDNSGSQFSGTIASNTNVTLNDIVYGGGKYVIVGDGGTIITISSGNVAETIVGATTYGLGSVAYGNGRYVATGQFSTVTTSTDGLNWRSIILPDTGGAYIYGVSYGDKFVAVGQYGQIWTSLDGLNWEERVSPATTSLYAVAYNNGQYVAVGGSVVLTSPDGITWTKQAEVAGNFQSITYGNGRFVAASFGGGLIASSVDGVQWKLNESGVTNNLNDIVYGNNTFVVVGNNVNLRFENSSVIYFGNGHTGGAVPSDSNTYAIGASAQVLNKGSMVRAGYSFTGWNTAANGSGTNYSAGSAIAMDMDNVTLYAQWTPNPTYTITYNGNGNTGGTAPIDSEAYEAGTVIVLKDKGSLVKTGYTFAGWNTAINGNGTNYSAGASTTILADVTLYAKWTPNPTYTVTYNGNGSTGGSVPVDSERHEAGEAVIVKASGSLVRTGYTFAGWNTLANGSGTNYASGATLTMGAANVTLYAKWTPNPTYTVTYSGNGSTGGSVPVDSEAYEAGEAVIVKASGSLVRTGYTFAGWNTLANGSGTNYASGATLTMGAANVTLYAKWTPNPTYSVTYNPNGSTGGSVPVDSEAYESGETVNVLDKGTLVKVGHTFAGWNTLANGTGTNYAAGATLTMGAANVTLYAKWTPNPTYSVTYNPNGSTGGSVPVDREAYEAGETVNVLDKGTLVKVGQTFAGWNTLANGTGTNYAAGATLTMGAANVTLYAKWTPNPTYSVTYNPNGSTGGSVPVDREAYEAGETVNVLDKGTLVKVGQTFAGWNTLANGTGTNYAAGATLTMGAANVTLYAKWTPNPTYTVTYNGNGSTGGSVPVDSEAYEAGETVNVLDKGNLVKAGHTFAGWNTLANGSGTNYAADATLPMGAANVTLYAKWTPNPTYTVTYNGNGSTGGSVPVDSEAYEAGETVNVLDKGTLVKTGHTFAGWNTASDGGGTDYAAGATLNMGAANVTLYAQWTKNPTYTMTYNGNGSTGGSVPVDSEAYEAGETVNVLDKGTLVKAGHTFEGWNTASDSGGTDYAADATLIMGAANVTLYAQWTKNPTYTMTYNGNGSTGGSVPVDSEAYEAGETVNVLDKGTLVRAGHTFEGWNTASDGGGTDYAAGATLTMGTTNVMLYAQWTENPTYTMTYNGNGSTGGSVPLDSEAYEAGETVNVLDKGTLVKAGHTFAGWNTLSDGGGTDYAAGATLTMGTTNVTLYAQWRPSGSTGGGPAAPGKHTSSNGKLTLPAGAIGGVSFGNVVEIYIPAGATDKPIDITIGAETRNEQLNLQDNHPVNGVFNIWKSIADKFKKLVTIAFSFDPAQLSEGQQPAVFYYEEAKHQWMEFAGGKVVDNWISVEVDQFGLFAVMCVEIVNGRHVLCSSPVQSPEFSDVPGHWAANAIHEAVKRGFVKGYPDGTFKPNHTVTRGEFAVMLMNALKQQVEGTELKFTDAAKIPAWAKGAVGQAVQAGIINGYQDDTFRPVAEITRAEMAVMIASALKLSAQQNAATGFADDQSIPTWAKGAVAALKNLGIIGGKDENTFEPSGKATRAEAVTVIMNMLAKKG